MLEVRLSAKLAASAEKVWSIVGNFNGLPEWHPWVKSSSLEAVPGGIGRRVAIVGGTAGHRELVERLLSFNAVERSYSYTVVAGPTPFRNYSGEFRIAADGDDSCTFYYLGRSDAAPNATAEDAIGRVQTFYEAGRANLIHLFEDRSSGCQS
jgi:Polyketide cyclase / dehydrase and lipid transport